MERRSTERGAAMVAMAVGMTAFLGLAVVAIDLGRLAHSASELQTAADAAATAGAMAMFRGKTTTQAKSEAQNVAGQNRVDGAAGSIPTADIKVGVYDFDTHGFTETLIEPQAVQVSTSRQVNNLIAGVFGSSMKISTIRKIATATFVGLGVATPTLPIAIGECLFSKTCVGNASCLPSFTGFPKDNDNRTQWTTFTSSSSSTPDIIKYMAQPCGDGISPPNLRVGDTTIVAGVHQAAANNLACLYDAGVRDHIVPVVGCVGTSNLSGVVIGFATIKLTGKSQGGVDFKVVYQERLGPGGGCAQCGTGTVGLVCENGRPGC